MTRKDTRIIDHVQFVVEFYLWLSYNYFVQIISGLESGDGGSRLHRITAARLAQWDKRRSAEREALGSNPGRTKTQGL